MIGTEVLVVGGGLAGSVAALSAARDGARVTLVSKSESTLRQASGLVDVLGRVDGDLVADPFAAIEDLPESHPYSVVGTEALREGLALFDDVTGDRYRGGDRNALVPTTQGTVKPTLRYPASVAPGIAGDGHETLLVGISTDPDFDAKRAADTLAGTVPGEVRGVTVRFPRLRDDAKRTRYAKLLTEDAEFRDALVEKIAPKVDGADRVGFPAVFGEDPAFVRAELEAGFDAAGEPVSVFEVPTGPPSIPGTRLRDLLRHELEAAGVELVTGVPVVDFEAESAGSGDEDGERVTSIVVDRNGARVPYAPEQVVLATGGLVGEGIDSERDRVYEPVFDLHVPHPEDRYDWSEEPAFGDHAFARFGVRIDDDARPLDADGAVAYENLRAAGAVVGGADTATGKAASGVSLATGSRAGTRAATAVTQS
ncbi:glycerol-3-phosphate dehydrogenase subunit GlpB [Haloarchaeobius iranensis]|uniref:Glycerol 3-phosphate dehydrogenase (Quinone) subunit B n=1 Tax=Haloarchaeobius iranensis TaxID=996166 RepID=A0A1G9ULB1_9EURY|nr:glycerol-3-phosphate dehydrogenase subunit GlpB [Haloarchaeobius iranensis]SDM60719.1 glycerol 3-phosphate dehydrogenase (quinone) subunit B [Haloarchaeobius iranensis]